MEYDFLNIKLKKLINSLKLIFYFEKDSEINFSVLVEERESKKLMENLIYHLK
jgi:hypothetical protein